MQLTDWEYVLYILEIEDVLEEVRKQSGQPRLLRCLGVYGSIFTGLRVGCLDDFSRPCDFSCSIHGIWKLKGIESRDMYGYAIGDFFIIVDDIYVDLITKNLHKLGYMNQQEP